MISGVNGNDSAGSDGAITFGTSNPGGANGLFGTGASASLIDNVNVSGAIEHTIEVYNQSGSFGLTISNSNIHDNTVASGSDGILIEMQGTASATMNITTNQFSNLKSQGIQVAANDSSTVNLTISGNTVTRGTQGNEGIVLSNGSNADLTTLVSNNTISGFGGVAIFVGQTAGNATASSLLDATISGNTITTPTTATNHAIIAFLTSTTGPGIAGETPHRQQHSHAERNHWSCAASSSARRTPRTPEFHATVTNNNVDMTEARPLPPCRSSCRRARGDRPLRRPRERRRLSRTAIPASDQLASAAVRTRPCVRRTGARRVGLQRPGRRAGGQ